MRAPDFRVVPESIRISTEAFSVELEAAGEDVAGRRLTLDVTGLTCGVMRIRFREKDPLHRRYEVVDSLVPFESAKVVYRPKKQTVSVGDGKSKLVIEFHPFQLDFFNAKGDHVLVLNQRHLLNWEFYRSRPAEVVEDVDGLWDEKFGGTHEDHKPRGPSSVGMDVTFVNSEHVYGIPTHATNLSLPATRGEKKRYDDPYRMYNLDVFEYELDNPMALYGHVPVMVAHSAAHTTGFFWLNAAETWIDVDSSTRPGSVQTHWISESGIIDLFVLPGPTPRDVVSQYARVTGVGELPPRFAIGYHQCKWNYKNELEISELDANFDKHEIPYDVSWLDIEHTNGKRYMTWDPIHFPTPKQMIDQVAAKGRRMVTIVDPHLKRDAQFNLHATAQKGGHYIKNRNGDEYDGWCWPGSSSWPDFLAKSVRDWWAGLFAYDVYQGSTPALFTWNDMNEPSVFNGPEVTMHKDAVHLDGFEHRDVHNLYGMGVHMATVQGQIERNKPEENKRPFVLSRALFAGTQRFGAIWTGDNLADWGHLRASTPMLLSLGLSGISFAGADVGGFFGNPDGELLARWYQLGALQPFFRAHAHLDSKRREPWIFPEPYLSAMRDAVRTRYVLLPYLYTLFHEASVDGVPVVRPLWFEFPQLVDLFAEETSFMLGSALLVHPVTAASVSSVTVKLPVATRWFRYDTLKEVAISADPSAGTPPVQDVTEDAPLERGAPMWIRGGSILAQQRRARRSTTPMLRDPVTLVIALDNQQRASGTFYWDDGESFDYRKRGKFVHRSFQMDRGRLSNIATGASASAADYSSQIHVERLVVVGLAAAPSQVVVVSDGGRQLEHAFENGVLTVRKPLLSVDENWTIEMKQ